MRRSEEPSRVVELWSGGAPLELETDALSPQQRLRPRAPRLKQRRAEQSSPALEGSGEMGKRGGGERRGRDAGEAALGSVPAGAHGCRRVPTTHVLGSGLGDERGREVRVESRRVGSGQGEPACPRTHKQAYTRGFREMPTAREENRVAEMILRGGERLGGRVGGRAGGWVGG